MLRAATSEPTALKLGVMDFWSPLELTFRLAPLVDSLGFNRYWLAEHPPQPNPQIAAALIAGLTERIRVGTAGVCLSVHNAFQLANDFLLLERLFPGRIDAGFCGGGASGLWAEALLEGRPDANRDPAVFAAKTDQLIHTLRGDMPAGDRFAGLEPWRERGGTPEIWSLGTGPRSATLAAERGISFGYSLFHHFSRDDTTAVEIYRQQFQSKTAAAAPQVVLAVAGVCAETKAGARTFVAAHRNEFIVPTIVGTPEQCRDQLELLADRYDVREFVFLDVAPDAKSRLRSYELLAEACGLVASATDNSDTAPTVIATAAG
ncbi:MAG: LLM class flavin-dependent oxidoreductase [Pirellulales bacterium]|nr:LLM class flavin-dependent oxidoreductase [Pirellulales bacterium]